jgi:hypothetical protein
LVAAFWRLDLVATIITSVVVSLLTTVIALYVFQPIQGQRQLIGEIATATRRYRTATSKVRSDWKTQGEREEAKAKAEEATQALLVLSAQLGASPATFPARGKLYRLYESIRFVEARENVSKASSELRAWAYWIRMGDGGAAQMHRLEVIKALDLPRD